MFSETEKASIAETVKTLPVVEILRALWYSKEYCCFGDAEAQEYLEGTFKISLSNDRRNLAELSRIVSDTAMVTVKNKLVGDELNAFHANINVKKWDTHYTSLRLATEKTQREFADFTGIDVGTIQKLETGELTIDDLPPKDMAALIFAYDGKRYDRTRTALD